MTDPTLFTVFNIKLNGSDLTSTDMDQLDSVEVDLSLFMPGMFTLTFFDPTFALLSSSRFLPGKSVDVAVKMGTATTTLISGEITALEPVMSGSMTPNLLTVRGYDKSHRLHWNRVYKTYLDVKDSDLATQVIGGAGLSASVTATSNVRKYVLQNNLTNWEFLQQLAIRNNYVLHMNGTQLYFGPPAGISGRSTAVALDPGTNVHEFRPRLTVASQLTSVQVRGWDVQQKQAIVGLGSQPATLPHPSTTGRSSAQTMGHQGKMAVLSIPVEDQAMAQKAAEALLTQARQADIQAEGVAYGEPTILPGGRITLSNSTNIFNGTYLVTRARHILRGPVSGRYETFFEVTSGSAATAGRLFLEGAGIPNGALGEEGLAAMIGIVTNNDDSQQYSARVKVKFPVMAQSPESADIESNWLRVVAPGAGAQRGIMWHPEVNDEVLVLFDRSNPASGYVVGGLWNGQDAPPIASGSLVANGKVKMREMRSRKGAIVRLTDDDQILIEIADAASGAKNSIVIDSQANKIILTADTEIDLTTKTVKVKGDTAINVDGGTVTVKGTAIKVEGSQSVEVKGMSVKVTADTTMDLKASASMTIDGGGMLTLKGGLVKIN